MRPQVGQLINNKYRLAKLLGDGGMGSVFEAQHEVLGSAVALKFLHPELARRQGLVQRFLQEARVSAKIQSPHVVKVTDVEQTPTGLPFMVMEFLKGSSLQALYEDNYRAGKRLSYEDALKYAVQILDGLEAAHEEGVVHRDLKPDNVMIVQGKKNKDVVKLLDFGIAKLKINGELYKGLTRPGVIMGTPEYMAPEQVFSADAVDARADIFSVAVMIFEMLAGRRPVGGDEAHQIAAAYLSGNIAKLGDLAPHVPSGLVEVIHKAMAADPKDRYGSIVEFREEMDPYLAEVSKPAYTTPPPVVAARSGNGEADRKSTPSPAEASNPRISSNGEMSQASADLAAEASAQEAERDSNHDVDGFLTDKVSRPWKGGGTQEIASISAKLEAAMGQKPVYDSTVEGQPFFPGSTAAYSAPSSDRPAPLRPGRTDIGGAVLPASTAMASGSFDSRSAGYPSPPIAPRRKRKSSMGFGTIMLVGLLVAGAVVGGVYGFEHINKTTASTKKDEGKTIALPTNKATQPVQQESVVAIPVNPPVATVPPVVTVATTPSTKPTNPTPTAPTNPGPRPSASNPPPMIPSTLPLPNWPPIELPFPGMGGPSTTTKKPADPAPKDSPPKKPGGPKLEPIPQGAIEPAPQPQPQPSTTTPSNPSTQPTRPAADGPKTVGTRKLPTRPSKGTTTTPSNESSKTAPTKAGRIPLGTRIAKPVH